MRFEIRKAVFLVAVLVLLTALPAGAQPWAGPVGLEIRVEDAKGLPVGGAQVQLTLAGRETPEGPPPVVTDARGQARIYGLAEAAWQIDVSREGFMTYRAEVAVRAGGRPEVVQATQMKVPGALRTLEVRFSRGRSTAAPRAETAPPPPPPRREIRPAPAPTPAPAPRQQEPPVAPQPAPAPAPTTPEPTPPAPTVEPPPRPSPAPTPAPAPAPPPSAPPPPSVPPPSPEPSETPEDTEPVLRTHRDRTCFECPPGESSLSLERVVAAGDGSGCGADIAARLQGGAVPADLPAGCHVLRITLPAGTRYTGYRYAVQEADCPAGRDCPGGTGRWPVDPVIVREGGDTVVLAPFASGGGGGERRATFTVYFATGTRRR